MPWSETSTRWSPIRSDAATVVSGPAEVLPLETIVVSVPAFARAGRSSVATVPSTGQETSSSDQGKSSRSRVVGRVGAVSVPVLPAVASSDGVGASDGDAVSPGVAEAVGPVGVGVGVLAPGKWSSSTCWSREMTPGCRPHRLPEPGDVGVGPRQREGLVAEALEPVEPGRRRRRGVLPEESDRRDDPRVDRHRDVVVLRRVELLLQRAVDGGRGGQGVRADDPVGGGGERDGHRDRDAERGLLEVRVPGDGGPRDGGGVSPAVYSAAMRRAPKDEYPPSATLPGTMVTVWVTVRCAGTAGTSTVSIGAPR